LEKQNIFKLTDENFIEVAKALGSSTRINILKLLSTGVSLNVNEIAGKLNLPLSTASVNIQILEDAGLIISIYQPGIRGSMRLCSIKYESIVFHMLDDTHYNGDNVYAIEIPVGAYFDCKVYPTCGLASTKNFISKDDDIHTFYSPNRFDAALIWFYKGYIEYRFPLSDVSKRNINRIKISLELCSEAPNYRMDWPSDIYFELNQKHVTTWTSTGDFGGRRGKHTPNWWSINSTQYGLLKVLEINNEGSFLDYKKVSNITLNELLKENIDFLSFKLGIKNDSKNIGGINIFGKGFGDYDQDIKLEIYYK